MTDKYIPGRVYSGVVNGSRKPMTRMRGGWSWVDRHGEINRSPDAALAPTLDVHGPLVVLDLDELPFELAISTTIEALRAEGTISGNWIADQIEEQTRPPLQVGVHLAFSRTEGRRAYMRWDGDYWWHSDANKSLADWESIHYIAPASSDGGRDD